MNFLNHKNILKLTLIYSLILLAIALIIALYIVIKMVFPPQLADQPANPQLQNVNQAIELITNQTIDE